MDHGAGKPSDAAVSEDVRTLHRLGYAQELARGLGGFSNFAVSLSIICILAGGLTSFHVGFCSVGGAAIGIGWPLMTLLALAVAASMGQVASAFPTAGGLYHWAAILGGRGWGWATAWFNLAGLVTVLAAINVGTFRFAMAAFDVGFDPATAENLRLQFLVVAGMTITQAGLNHLGIKVTRWLTDLSGWWILLMATTLTIILLACAPAIDPTRLVTFTNFSGVPGDNPVWPQQESLTWLFALGLLLPAYTITGFDASAHVAEETVHAASNVPRGIVRSVWVSGLFGWAMLSAAVLAMPDPAETAKQGERAFAFILVNVVNHPTLAYALLGGAVVAQYLCGLATVTSASRMAFAFARDGGLPFSSSMRHVSPRFRTPPVAIWAVALGSVAFTAYTPVYTTITAVCVIFLYVSYVLPIAIGFLAHGRWWKEFGPWCLGRWYRPLAAVSVLGCLGLLVVGVQPPNEKAGYVVLGMSVGLALAWRIRTRHSFPGPPQGLLTAHQRDAICAAEEAVHETGSDQFPTERSQ